MACRFRWQQDDGFAFSGQRGHDPAASDPGAARQSGNRTLRIRQRGQEGRPEGKLGHNCSGKHAGFLAACRTQGWPLASSSSRAYSWIVSSMT